MTLKVLLGGGPAHGTIFDLPDNMKHIMFSYQDVNDDPYDPYTAAYLATYYPPKITKTMVYVPVIGLKTGDGMMVFMPQQDLENLSPSGLNLLDGVCKDLMHQGHTLVKTHTYGAIGYYEPKWGSPFSKPVFESLDEPKKKEEFVPGENCLF